MANVLMNIIHILWNSTVASALQHPSNTDQNSVQTVTSFLHVPCMCAALHCYYSVCASQHNSFNMIAKAEIPSTHFNTHHTTNPYNAANLYDI